MSKKGNWVPIDKNVVQAFKEIVNRPYSRVEALVSHSIDVNCDRGWTISGYSKQWQWSRDKVRKFICELQSETGHCINHGPTPIRQGLHLIDAGLREETDTNPTLFNPTGSRQEADRKPTPGKQEADTKPTGSRHQKTSKHGQSGEVTDTKPTSEKQEADTKPTGGRQEADRKPDTTIKTKTKTNKKNSAKKSSAAKDAAVRADEKFYTTKTGKKLSGDKLLFFEKFWTSFNDKRGKAAAADAWLKIPGYSAELAAEIIQAAEIYAGHRPGLIAGNHTPKMAEGWLTSRRYEDDLQPTGQTGASITTPHCPSCDYFIRKSCKGGKERCSSYRPHPTKA
jgi:hypothetical protein